MRRLLWVLITLAVVLVVGDRVAVVEADHQVATRIAREQGLVARPDVSIGGFPFLTQAVAGHYDDVKLTLHDLRRGPVVVTRLTARLSGVHVPLSEVLTRHVGRVPVDRATAQVFVDWSDVNRWLGDRHLRVGPAPDGRIRVTATAQIAGQTVGGSATGRLSVTRSAVVVSAGGPFDLQIPLPGLPFRIRFITARSTQAGLVVDASASGLVLRTGSA